VRGTAWTLNACVAGHGVVVTAPTLQITGEPRLTAREMGACGNDGTATTRAAGAMLDQARRLGEALSGDGFAGLFGVDFVVDGGGTPWLLEVNPRLVSSVGLATQLEARAGRLPLIARHFMAIVDAAADRAPLDLAAGDALGGSQIVLHNLEPDPRVVSGKVACGAWRVGTDPRGVARTDRSEGDRAGATEVGPAPGELGPAATSGGRSVGAAGAVLLDGLREGEWLAIPAGVGRLRAPGAEVARLQRIGPVTDDAGALLPEAIAAAEALYAALALAPAPVADQP
jgi:hypothetical protein